MNETEQVTPRLLADPRQDAFIASLLEYGKIAPAAQAAGVPYQTARRWLAGGPVKEAYAEARREVMRAALSKLAAAATQAVDTLVALMAEGITPCVRVQAASNLLNCALKAQDALELDSRIATLGRERDERDGGHPAGAWHSTK